MMERICEAKTWDDYHKIIPAKLSKEDTHTIYNHIVDHRDMNLYDFIYHNRCEVITGLHQKIYASNRLDILKIIPKQCVVAKSDSASWDWFGYNICQVFPSGTHDKVDRLRSIFSHLSEHVFNIAMNASIESCDVSPELIDLVSDYRDIYLYSLKIGVGFYPRNIKAFITYGFLPDIPAITDRCKEYHIITLDDVLEKYYRPHMKSPKKYADVLFFFSDF